MKIYLAGKISETNWRATIVDGLAELAEESYGGECFLAGFPVLEGAIRVGSQRHDYVGPYYVLGGHGETAGEDSHGMLGMDPSLRFGRLVSLCFKAIQSADLVFAWLDDVTAYGTIAELGYAAGRGKRIAIAGDFWRRDLWFCYALAFHFFHASQPRAGFEYVMRHLAMNHPFEDYRPGYIYLLQMGEYYKIGRTVAIERRQRELSGTKLPHDLVQLHTIKVRDIVAVETALHRRYAEYRSNGEWFRLPDTCVQEICNLQGDEYQP
jgi:hypothetical protein